MSECGIYFDHFSFENFISNIEPVYHIKVGDGEKGGYEERRREK